MNKPLPKGGRETAKDAFPRRRQYFDCDQPRDESMDSTKLKSLLAEGMAFIAANLAECCREVLEFQDGTLRTGKIRSAAAIYAKVAPTGTQGLKMAIDETVRQAMQQIAKGK